MMYLFDYIVECIWTERQFECVCDWVREREMVSDCEVDEDCWWYVLNECVSE